MRKHVVLTVALLCLLAFSLVGCNSDDDIGKKQPADSKAEETTAFESSETTETTAETTEKKTEETTSKSTDTSTSNGDGYTKRY